MTTRSTKGQITKSTLTFLRDLGANNERDWFNEHKGRYTTAHENVIELVDSVARMMEKHDRLVAKSAKQTLYRIYRDTRFGKDKTPYKTHFAGSFKRDTQLLRGGYFFHIAPGNSFAGGGFYQPSPDDLKRIRHEIAADDKPLRKIVARAAVKKYFDGDLQGDKVKTAPKGYAKDHPAIDLLRHKSFYFMRSFTDKETLSPDFASEINKTFKALRPYFDYMSEVLTTDTNGQLLKGLK